MTPRKTGEQRRAEIIETALLLAAELGPDRITAEAIANRLGISQPAIFKHFPRKGDIWDAVIDQLVQSLSRVWRESTTDKPPEQRLFALLDAHFAFIAAHPAVPLVLLSPELQARHPPLRQTIMRLMGLFHSELRQTISAGNTPPDNADQRAWMMLSLVQGIAIRWALSGHAFDIRAEGGALIRLADYSTVTDLARLRG
ncbi:Transcriptional regulator, TetR family [Magnetospirillum gryphiswaldense MSR-1 v2]|uniref:Transcriptional regulator, TetR family n=1 Tax=Magnetospirillum gryphiswaldense (strain DSM 6361 / JCM 21280 / NBRC 15271 / MSR-1) TaxID=431944 RepID=V6F1F0_MAGGM|nr:TetR/AcrR family transcriptional regulator [Magnetospirillum gryphiswaldense]CDK99345.1 Transcriptional regulator, TetR family [Magnetospirillum gryphiswaldense MSR-1 v2]